MINNYKIKGINYIYSGGKVVIGGVRYDSIAESCRDKKLNKYDF